MVDSNETSLRTAPSGPIRRPAVVPALATRAIGRRGLTALGVAVAALASSPQTQPIESLHVADALRIARSGSGAAAPAGSAESSAALRAGVLPVDLAREIIAATRGAASTHDPIEVDWRLLAGLDYDTGDMTDDLRAVVGQEAKVPGFMVPLEDYLERVTEFLLVPYVGACVHTPPPPPNQLVYVRLPEGERAQVEWWDPIWVEGVLEIEETENVYGSVSYTIAGASITSYSD